jgi:hypothetical protein
LQTQHATLPAEAPQAETIELRQTAGSLQLPELVQTLNTELQTTLQTPPTKQDIQGTTESDYLQRKGANKNVAETSSQKLLYAAPVEHIPTQEHSKHQQPNPYKAAHRKEENLERPATTEKLDQEQAEKNHRQTSPLHNTATKGSHESAEMLQISRRDLQQQLASLRNQQAAEQQRTQTEQKELRRQLQNSEHLHKRNLNGITEFLPKRMPYSNNMPWQ